MRSNLKKKSNLFLTLIAIALILFGCQGGPKEQDNRASAESDWEMLFDGKTLNGWNVNNQDFDHPDAKPEFNVEDGMIVCNSTLNTSGGYLITEKSYKNFILELDVKIDTLLNSGIQCRGQIWKKDTTTLYIAGDEKGTEHQGTWKAGYIWGYQIEIDPSPRSWTGGLYEPGNRGWVVTLADNEAARKAFRKHDWNHFKIMMNGNHIQVWVNGIPTLDTEDNMSASGFIGFQFHGAGRQEQENMKSKWKNIRIKQLY